MTEAELAQAARLAISLSIAGGLLLVIEVFVNNRIFLIFGVSSLLGAIYMAYTAHGVVATMLFLLGYITFLSIGFLVILTYLPNSPITQAFLKRSRKKQYEEEEADEIDF